MTNWLKGPEFIAWLEPWLDYTNLHPNLKRSVRRCRSGENLSLSLADTLLVTTELSIWDIPDELWTVSRRGRRHPDETRNDAIKRVNSGEGVVSVARSLGADRKTVRLWTQRAGGAS